jgi:hypothetical protein
VPGTATTIASKIRFVDAGGTPAPVVRDGTVPLTNGPAGSSLTQYMLGFVPPATLAVDGTYTIALTSDRDAVLGFIDETFDEAAAALDTTQTAVTQFIRVFSGSRPLPVEVQATNGTAKPLTSVRVRFSETVAASSLAEHVSIVDQHGATLPSCVWAPLVNACADATTSQVSDVFDLVLTTPASLSELEGGSLSVSGLVRGNGRTIGEAAALVGRTLDPATGALIVSLDAASWFLCDSSGDQVCFRDQTAR